MRRALYAIVVAACAGSPAARTYSDSADAAVQELLPALAGRGNQRLALLPAASDGDVAKAVGDLFTDDLTASLSRVAGLVLVDRADLDKVLAELSLQQTG